MKSLTVVLCLFATMAVAQTKPLAKTKPVKKDAKAAETNTVVADRKAEFVGGNAAMEKYILTNLKYPEKLDTDTSIKTRNVFMKFMVDKTGKVNDVSVMKGIKGCKECSEEATRVVSSMPNWVPAIEASEPVDAWFTLPITFSKNH
jgi:periplasmic protein TonB